MRHFKSERFDINAVVPGLLMGAGLMYFLDPQLGRRRRAVARDKSYHYTKVGRSVFSKASRDFNHRLHGRMAENRLTHRNEMVPDDILVERIRSKIGRVVSHPRAIHLECKNGHVVLSGAILASEVADCLSTVNRVRGVHYVTNRLSVYSHPGDVPSLQGGIAPKPQPRVNSMFPLIRFASNMIPAVLISAIAFGVVRKRFALSGLFGVLLVRFGMGIEERHRRRRAEREHIGGGLVPEQESLTNPLTYVRMYSHH